MSLCYFDVEFQTRHSLESHYMSHLGIRPHACKWCMRRFTDASNWRKHERNCRNQRNAFNGDLPTMIQPTYSSMAPLAVQGTCQLENREIGRAHV